MPFQGGIYYPYSRDTHGTHSSAGIPSLLNSPLSQQLNGHCAPGMTPSSGVFTAPPFRFRPRRESVDWRRIIAVNIDEVVSQIHVDTLQEHIMAVTFCNLDSERCPRCQSPVDPALVKLLQLAQLSVEWLLHCQEVLTLNLHSMEDRLETAGKDHEQMLVQQKKLEEKIKMLNGELKQRKKVICNQQLMIAPGISHKCEHCEKSFLNAMYLQKHMQRRHPEEYEKQMRSDSENKSEIERLKSETTRLKDQIVQLQQDLQTKTAQEKEKESLHREVLWELDRFKAEEIARVDRKFEDNRDGMRRELEFICNRNIQGLNVANQQQPSRPEKSSPVQMEPEKDQNSYKEMHQQAMQKLEQQLKKQDKKWESRMQQINTQHELEKNQLQNELNRLQKVMAEQQEQGQRQKQELLEKEQTIKTQKEQMKTMATNKPAKVVETQVLLTSAAPEPKSKKVIIEDPPSALMLDPIQELSEEDRESSSLSEAKAVAKKMERPPEKKQRTVASAMKSEPSLRRDIRPNLEKFLNRRLESYGVKSNCLGLKAKELTSMLNKVQLARDRAAETKPEYWFHYKEINKAVNQKLGASRKGSDHHREKPKQVVHFRTRSSSLPARATQVKSAERQPKTPQPAPRSKSQPQPKTSTPKNKTQWNDSYNMTPPFGSDEDSEEDEDDDTDTEEELHFNQKNKPSLVQNGTNQATPVLTKQASVSSTSGPKSRGVTGGVTQTAVTYIDSEDEDEEDWSDVSELQEIDPKGLHSFKDQNGNLEKKGFGKENKISEIAKKMEKQFTERLGKKPAGGVSILPERKDEELSCTDLEESNEWVSSSLEGKVEKSKPAHSSAPLRKSLDSASTSVWGTSTGKGPRSSLTEASTGSTLKSSLYYISDVNDDDFSNN